MRDLFSQLYDDRHWIEDTLWTHDELMEMEAELDRDYSEDAREAWRQELVRRRWEKMRGGDDFS